MSEVDPIDLVCQARRHLLPSGARGSIDALLRRSPEARLANLLVQGFEGESSVQRGDDAVAKRIVNGALGTLSRPRAQRLRVRMCCAAAVVLLVAGAATAWRANHPGASQGLPRSPLPPASAIAQNENARANTSQARSPAAGSVTGLGTLPNQASFGEPRKPKSTIAAPVLEQRPVATPAPASGGDVVSATTHGSITSAPELFAEANRLRCQGRSAEAMDLYRRLVEGYPTARETPPGRLALAKSLSSSHPTEALEQYRLLAAAVGPLQAEALWGLAESARRLGQRTLEQRAAADLLWLYPDSLYADVAREHSDNDTP